MPLSRYRLLAVLLLVSAGLGYLVSPVGLTKSQLLSLAVHSTTPQEGFGVVGEVLSHLEHSYVSPERLRPPEMVRTFVRELERQIPELIVRQEPTGLTLSKGGATKSVTIKDDASLFEVYWVLRDILSWLGLTDRDRPLIYRALTVMLSSLDPHTVLLTPEEYQDLRAGSAGEFIGIGVVITQEGDNIVVISPIEGTPAANAGIRAGDILVKVDGVLLRGVSLNEVVKLLRGKEGTLVTVWIQRKGVPQLLKFELERTKIEIRSVGWRELDGDTALIRIKQFNNHTYEEMKAALEKIKERRYRYVILDLSNNPGGLVYQAMKVADLFLSEGLIFYTKSRTGPRERIFAHRDNTVWKGPLAVIVNGGTASSAEILAGSLKEAGRALLVGQRTFGKGSIQALYDNSDGSGLKVTIAHYILRHDVAIDRKGIVPHIYVREVCTDCTVHLPDEYRERGEIFTISMAIPREELRSVGGAPDKVVRFVQTVLEEAGDHYRDPKRLRSVLAAVQKEYEEELIEAWGAKGIDWSDGPCDASALAVELSSVRTMNTSSPLRLHVSLRNDGSSDLYRIWFGVRVLDQRIAETMVGRLGAGGRVHKEITVDGRRFDVPGRYAITVDVFCNARRITARRLWVSVAPRGEHALLLHYRILDDIRGDMDGILEPGELGRLHFLVLNSGTVPARNIRISFKKPEGAALSVEHGGDGIPAILPGEMVSLDYPIEYHEHERRKKDKVWLEFSVMTEDEEEYLTARMDFSPTMLTIPMVAANATVRVLRDAPVFASPYHRHLIGTVPKGTVFVAPQEVGAWMRIRLSPSRWAFVKGSDVKETDELPSPSWHPIVDLATPSVSMSMNSNGFTVNITHSLGVMAYLVDETSPGGTYYRKMAYRRFDTPRAKITERIPLDMLVPSPCQQTTLLRIRAWSTTGGVRTSYYLLSSTCKRRP